MNINLLISNIQNLCNKKNISVDKMLKECTLKPSVVDNMKKGSFPSIDKVYLIAEYFNVSVDYLLTGKEQNSSSNLTDEELELLDKFRHLLEIDKGRILERIETIYASYSPEQKENVSQFTDIIKAV